MKPKAIILYTDGINTEYETRYALEQAGAEAEVVHLNQLINREKRLADYQIMFCPGGFSYGDDIASAKIFAAMLLNHVSEDIQEFIEKDKIVVGVCNGFQLLLRMGLLPFRNVGVEQPEAALCENSVGHHTDYWVKMKVEPNRCVFLRHLEGKIIGSPVAHGEGRFLAPEASLKNIEVNDQVVLRYVDSQNNPTQTFPYNPNGSALAIAGICDETGKIFGMMPHPERNCALHHDPNWHSLPKDREPEGMWIMRGMVRYFQ